MFVGKIVDKMYAEQLIKNGKGFVSYKNEVSVSELIKIYGENNIFIMPSHHETFGLVYPEAMSQGMPVIYSEGEGFDGYFKNGFIGYSVDPNNTNDIARNIKFIVDNYEYISKNAINSYGKFN